MGVDADGVLGKREPLTTMGGKVSRWSHYGSQREGFLKRFKQNYCMILLYPC